MRGSSCCPAQAPQGTALVSYRCHGCFPRGNTGNHRVVSRAPPAPSPALRGSRGIGAELPPHRPGHTRSRPPACCRYRGLGRPRGVRQRQQNTAGQQHPPGRPRSGLGRRRCAAPLRGHSTARPGGPGHPGTRATQPARSEGPGALLQPRARSQDGSAPLSSGANHASLPTPRPARYLPTAAATASRPRRKYSPARATSGPTATSDPGSKTPSRAGAQHGGLRGRGERSGAGRDRRHGERSAGPSDSIPQCARGGHAGPITALPHGSRPQPPPQLPAAPQARAHRSVQLFIGAQRGRCCMRGARGGPRPWDRSLTAGPHGVGAVWGRGPANQAGSHAGAHAKRRLRAGPGGSGAAGEAAVMWGRPRGSRPGRGPASWCPAGPVSGGAPCLPGPRAAAPRCALRVTAGSGGGPAAVQGSRDPPRPVPLPSSGSSSSPSPTSGSSGSSGMSDTVRAFRSSLRSAMPPAKDTFCPPGGRGRDGGQPWDGAATALPAAGSWGWQQS